MNGVFMFHTTRLAVLVFSTLLSASVSAADVKVSDAWIRIVPGGAPAGGYFVLHNGAMQPIVLVGARSAAFGRVMMHKTAEEGGVSRMQPVERVEVIVGGKVAFAPGGYHLMLMQPNRKVEVGDQINITLEFAGGQRFTSDFQVRGPTGK